ncbi:hypothetical protein DN824_13665 [Stutzerimonas nosocomialis]|nr:hypothetical protein DN824_13665 [Stutzerimonas nosocomialis]
MRGLPMGRARASTLVCVMLLAGCQTHLEPRDYPSGYGTLIGSDGQTVLLPQACLAPVVPDEPGDGSAPRLPPGCANSLNLLQMVERREDLLEGRATGPAMAAPVGRAAQYYLHGVQTEEQRRRQQEQQGQTDTRRGAQ